MRRARVFIIIAMVSASSVFALDFKALEVDKPVNCSLLDFAVGEITGCSTAKEWTVVVDFLGKETPALLSKTEQGILKSVTLTSFNYQRGLEYMLAEYGKPYRSNYYEIMWIKNGKTYRLADFTGMGPMIVITGQASRE